MAKGKKGAKPKGKPKPYTRAAKRQNGARDNEDKQTDEPSSGSREVANREQSDQRFNIDNVTIHQVESDQDFVSAHIEDGEDTLDMEVRQSQNSMDEDLALARYEESVSSEDEEIVLSQVSKNNGEINVERNEEEARDRPAALPRGEGADQGPENLDSWTERDIDSLLENENVSRKIFDRVKGYFDRKSNGNQGEQRDPETGASRSRRRSRSRSPGSHGRGRKRSRSPSRRRDTDRNREKAADNQNYNHTKGNDLDHIDMGSDSDTTIYKNAVVKIIQNNEISKEAEGQRASSSEEEGKISDDSLNTSSDNSFDKMLETFVTGLRRHADHREESQRRSRTRSRDKSRSRSRARSKHRRRVDETYRREPQPHSSHQREPEPRRRSEAEERAEQLVLEAEQGKARIMDVPGENSHIQAIDLSNDFVHSAMCDETYLMVAAHIDQGMKQRIWNHEYIDFAKLLASDRVDAEDDM